jgi:hypothetical protein
MYVPILSDMNPVHVIASCFRKTYFLILPFLPRLVLPGGSDSTLDPNIQSSKPSAQFPLLVSSTERRGF